MELCTLQALGLTGRGRSPVLSRYGLGGVCWRDKKEADLYTEGRICD